MTSGGLVVQVRGISVYVGKSNWHFQLPKSIFGLFFGRLWKFDSCSMAINLESVIWSTMPVTKLYGWNYRVIHYAILADYRTGQWARRQLAIKSLSNQSPCLPACMHACMHACIPLEWHQSWVIYQSDSCLSISLARAGDQTIQACPKCCMSLSSR